jgi:hypothetical protein
MGSFSRPVGVLTKTQAQHFPNIGLEHYCYANPFSSISVDVTEETFELKFCIPHSFILATCAAHQSPGYYYWGFLYKPVSCYAKLLNCILRTCMYFLVQFLSTHIHDMCISTFRRADYATPLYPQKLVLTSPTSGSRLVGIVCLQTEVHKLDWRLPQNNRSQYFLQE